MHTMLEQLLIGMNTPFTERLGVELGLIRKPIYLGAQFGKVSEMRSPN